MNACTASTSMRLAVVVELEAARKLAPHSSALERPRQPRERLLTSASSIVSGGSRRSVLGAGGVHHQPLLEQRALHHRGRGDVELAGEHQAAPPHRR